MMLVAVTDFPHPDSPTMPSVSPSPTSNVTPSTANTTPARVKNRVSRSCTWSTGLTARKPTKGFSSWPATIFPLTLADVTALLPVATLLRLVVALWIECVAKTITKERETKHRHADRQNGEQQQVRTGLHQPNLLARFTNHLAP